MPPENPKNNQISHLVVWFLGTIGLVTVIGLMFLTYCDKKIDGGLIAVASGVVGALAGLLANPNSRQRQADAPVPVVNAPGEALDVQASESETPVLGIKPNESTIN